MKALAAALVLCAAPAFADPVQIAAPVTPACISSPFGWRHQVGPHAPAGMHNGIDMPAPAGAYVHAAASGHVLKVERMGIGGLQIILQHRGFETLYAHLGTLVPALAEGKRDVAAGEPIGRIGRTGITYGTHLFFEVMVDGKPVDPTDFLAISHC